MTEYLTEALVGLIPIILGIVSVYLKKFLTKQKIEQEAIQTLLDGIVHAQDEFVREAKKAAADGKLTKAEIAAAKDLAIEQAYKLASGPVRDILMSWGRPRLESLIWQLKQSFRSN